MIESHHRPSGRDRGAPRCRRALARHAGLRRQRCRRGRRWPAGPGGGVRREPGIGDRRSAPAGLRGVAAQRDAGGARGRRHAQRPSGRLRSTWWCRDTTRRLPIRAPSHMMGGWDFPPAPSPASRSRHSAWPQLRHRRSRHPRGLRRGLNYVFWNPTARKLTKVLRDACRDASANVWCIATGPPSASSAARCAAAGARAQGARHGLPRRLPALLARPHRRWTAGVVDELVKLKEEGKVRALGVSIHDRERAGRLAEDSPLDLLMIRYNAAHPGAERDIFPHLAPRKPAVVAYTATELAQAPQAPARLGRPRAHRRRLLPLLPLQPARGRGAHGAARQRRAATRTSPRWTRGRSPRGDGLDAGASAARYTDRPVGNSRQRGLAA